MKKWLQKLEQGASAFLLVVMLVVVLGEIVPRDLFHVSFLWSEAFTASWSARADNILTRGQEVAVKVDEAQAIAIELAAGQSSLHHERIVHGSNSNTGTAWRIGLAVRYIRPTAKQIVDASDTAAIVRGTDRYRHLAPEPRPVSDMAPDSLNFLEAILATRAGGVFRRKPGWRAANAGR